MVKPSYVQKRFMTENKRPLKNMNRMKKKYGHKQEFGMDTLSKKRKTAQMKKAIPFTRGYLPMTGVKGGKRKSRTLGKDAIHEAAKKASRAGRVTGADLTKKARSSGPGSGGIIQPSIGSEPNDYGSIAHYARKAAQRRVSPQEMGHAMKRNERKKTSEMVSRMSKNIKKSSGLGESSSYKKT